MIGCCDTCPMKGMLDCQQQITNALETIEQLREELGRLRDIDAKIAFDRIHYNIAELNLIKTGFDIAEIKRRFRAEFEEKMELGIDDCINWADWLDSVVSEMQEDAKKGEKRNGNKN